MCAEVVFNILLCDWIVESRVSDWEKTWSLKLKWTSTGQEHRNRDRNMNEIERERLSFGTKRDRSRGEHTVARKIPQIKAS